MLNLLFNMLITLMNLLVLFNLLLMLYIVGMIVEAVESVDLVSIV